MSNHSYVVSYFDLAPVGDLLASLSLARQALRPFKLRLSIERSRRPTLEFQSSIHYNKARLSPTLPRPRDAASLLARVDSPLEA